MSLALFAFFKYQHIQDRMWTLTFLFHSQANTVLTKDFVMVLFHNLIQIHTDQFLLWNNSGIDTGIQLYIFDASGQFFFLLV